LVDYDWYRERVQKLEAEVVSLRGNNRRLKAAEASWAEAEARAAAHAGVEEALRYQLSHLQNAVKVCFCLASSSWTMLSKMLIATPEYGICDSVSWLSANSSWNCGGFAMSC
jgi:NAD-specific glutamate dehydrogenase